MIQKFRTGPGSAMERAQQEIRQAEATALPAQPVIDRKTQTAGASGALSKSMPSAALPIVGTRTLNTNRVRIPAAFLREAGEYADAEFLELKADIERVGGNLDPIDVRMLIDVPGFDAELLAGSRRLMACRDLKLGVLATVRECDDRMANRIHESENNNRKNKSPYSRGLNWNEMFSTGIYATLQDMADDIGAKRPLVYELTGFVANAPAGMWAKVSNPSSLSFIDARALISAYGKPGFNDSVSKATTLSAKELVALARASLRPTGRPATTEARLVKRGKGYVVSLPTDLSKPQLDAVLAAVKKALPPTLKV